MLKKIIILLGVVIAFAAAGFFAEPYLFRPAPSTMETMDAPEKPQEQLFKMPLGKFTLQIIHKKRTLHLLFDIDVYIAGLANFERMNGAMGRASLRDATIRELSKMSETALWVDSQKIEDLDRRFLAEQIVRQLYRTYPMVRTARVNRMDASVSARQ